MSNVEESMTKHAKPSRRFRVIAILVTVFCGLIFGSLLSRWHADYTANHMQTASTRSLLNIVRRQDNLFRRTYRDWVIKLPAAVQKFVPTAQSMFPDAQKPDAIKQLALRTNESSAIVPVLVDQLNRLTPQDWLAGAYVSALAKHGRPASNAIPWLEAIVNNPTNTYYVGGGYGTGSGPLTLIDVYQSLAAISGDPHVVFTLVTNQLEPLCFPPGGITNLLAIYTTPASQQDYRSRVTALIEVLGGLNVPKPEQVQFLLHLFDGVSQTAKDASWLQLCMAAPKSPLVRTYAIERLNDPRNRNTTYLAKLLVWARSDPQLIDQIEQPIRAWIPRTTGLDYWELTERLVGLGTNSYRFADAMVGGFFTNRLTSFYGRKMAGWSEGYHFPPSLEKFIRDSHADVSGLLDQLRTAALTPSNRYRFDDARVYSLLGGKDGLELEMLKDRVGNASNADLKMMIGRYARLETNQTTVAEFLEGYLGHNDPQVRRHALLEMSRLGDAAKQYLSEIDQMIQSDKSQVVRWQAQRTANRLRGIDPDTGIRNVGPIAEPQGQ